MKNKNMLILKTPLKVTWKISKSDPNLIRKIAKDLVDSKVFFLKLNPGGTVIHEEVYEIIDFLVKNTVRVSIQIDTNTIDKFLSSEIPALKLEELIIEIQTLKDFVENERNITYLNSQLKLPIYISISINNNNIDEISLIIKKAESLNINKIIFINPELSGRKIKAKGRYIFSFKKWNEFKSLIKKNNEKWGNKINFIIHDYFIWKEFQQNSSEMKTKKGEYNGCQAGNEIAYVASNGDVYPCISMPLKIGNLNKSSLKEIWNKKETREIYNTINQEIELCTNCRLTDCRGGCKGLIYFLNNSFSFQDRLCPFKVSTGEL